MTFKEFFKRFLAVLFVLLLWAGIWAARSTLILGFAAAMIAVGISIPSGWLQGRGLRRGWSIALSTLGIFAGLLLLILFVIPQLVIGLADLFGNVPSAIRAVLDVYQSVRSSGDFLQNALPALPEASENTTIAPERAREILNQLVDASLAIAPTLLGGVSTVVAVVVNIVFVLFISIFFLVEPKIYVKASLFLLPKRYHERAVHVWNELYHTVRMWITSLSLSIAITAGLVWFILGVVLGMPNAIVVAVFAGLATFVPNVGAFLPLIPILIFSLASDNPVQVFYMAPAYLAIQLFESNVITPSIVKAELEIPPGALMLFQLLITIAFGALGLLLAVPMLAVLVALVREVYSYDLLGLRNEQIALGTDHNGALVLLDKDAIDDNFVDDYMINDDVVATVEEIPVSEDEEESPVAMAGSESS